MRAAHVDRGDLKGELKAEVTAAVNRWPAVGLAVGVVRDGSLEWFHGHGVADLTTSAPVTEDTVFRIASVSKTFTAVAVMQLWEKGLVDLDAPVADYLRAYRLVPATAEFRPVTLRHLLTHTAGIPALRGLADLLRPTLGWGVPAGRPVLPLAEYYRDGLRVEVEPGTKWSYGNHGYATLGQIVEDVSGQPFGDYLRQHVFGPLGMHSTDVVREPVSKRLATGYALRSHGPRPAADREAATPGAAAVYSTTADLARYLSALLGGGANQHGSVLQPETLAMMFAPHYQPDPRVPGMGLAFFRGEVSGHRTVGHDGIWPGFLSQLVAAPDDGIGVVVLANTGGLDGRGAPVPLSIALLRRLLGLPPDAVRTDLPARPEFWPGLCGRYGPDPGLLTNLPLRMMLGTGAEVKVHGGHLVLSGLSPLPAVRRGMRLVPDDDCDPYAFRVDFSEFGLGICPVVFTRGPDGEATSMHLGLAPISLQRRRTRSGRRQFHGIGGL